MALIQRPVKQFGFRTYTDDFNAAPLNPTPPPTHVYEIQTAEVDGDFDTAYALVNGNIDNANIAPAAGIVYAKLNLTNSIVAADTAPAGVSVRQLQTLTATYAGNATAFAEEDLLVFLAMTTRGGTVEVRPSDNIIVQCPSGLSTDSRIRLYRDATLLNLWSITVGNASTPAGNSLIPIAMPPWYDQPAAGTYVYKYTIETIGAGCTISAMSGKSFLVEHG